MNADSAPDQAVPSDQANRLIWLKFYNKSYGTMRHVRSGKNTCYAAAPATSAAEAAATRTIR